MKQIVVLSGKGGTGKTSVVASFAGLAERPVLADCDVDAADLHLVLSPEVTHEEDFSGGARARVSPEKCTACGRCEEVCRFGAARVGDVSRVDPVACEGCGVCAWFCPQKAIELEKAVNGRWFVSDTRYGPMVHARLGIAEENSGKLVTLVKNRAKEIAETHGHPHLIVDGAPGIGCPVIASVAAADLVLVVTEPTLSGEHDLKRVADLTKHFGVPTVVCINKHDINEKVAQRIRETAAARDIRIVGTIRYDKAVSKAQTVGATVLEYTSGPVARDIEAVWRHVVYALG
jgi:MinD superfamily P-loop ATPase